MKDRFITIIISNLSTQNYCYLYAKVTDILNKRIQQYVQELIYRVSTPSFGKFILLPQLLTLRTSVWEVQSRLTVHVGNVKKEKPSNAHGVCIARQRKTVDGFLIRTIKVRSEGLDHFSYSLTVKHGISVPLLEPRCVERITGVLPWRR